MTNNGVLSYKAWLKDTKNSATLLNPYQDYLEYVNEWYEGSFGGKTTAELTAEEYTDFLLTLKTVTTDDDILSFIDKLDYSVDDEVETAIPYFAQNLRDIAKYISVKRDDSKYASKDYSYLGSNDGLSREIYKSLLETYASNSALTSDEILKLVQNTSIEIEELYDDNEYMDKSPNKTADDYFDMDRNAAFYEDVDPDYLRWVIAAGFNDIYSNNDNINPSVSGTLPLSGYINYSDDSEETSHFKGNLPTSIIGEEQYYLSGADGVTESMDVYATATKPWDNLSNRYFPTIANLPLIDATYSKYDSGGFLIPSKLGMGTAIGKNKFYKFSTLTMQGSKLNFPNPSIYSNGYSLSKEYQDASITYDSYLNWIDIKQSSGRGRGILGSDGTYQEMSPYQTTQESTSMSFLGMNQIGDKTDPWYLSQDKTWENDEKFPPDFRNIYDIDAWYVKNADAPSGEQDRWGIDIYGNNYGLYKDNNFSNFYRRGMDATGKLYVRNASGSTTSYETFYENSLSGSLSGFGIDKLRTFNIYNDIIVMEDFLGQVMAQTITLEDGEYLANSADVETLSIGNPFDHFYDDRTNELYVGRYEIVNSFVEITVYKFVDGRFLEVYSTASDSSDDMTALRSGFSIFNTITQSPSMTISPMDDKLFLTYVGGQETSYIVSIPLSMTSGLTVDEIVVVNPVTGGSSTEVYATESRKLLKTMVSDDKLILMLEGSDTNSKYLQVVPL